MPRVPTVSAFTLAPLFRHAATFGIERAALLATVALSELDRDDEVGYDKVTALWNRAAADSGDAAFGVHAAERLTAGVFDVVEYAALSSATLAEALAQLCRYQRLVTRVARYELDGEWLRLTYDLGASGVIPSRHASEYLLAAVLVKARQGTGLARLARAVHFRHAQSASSGEQRRFFDCPLLFEQACDQILLDPAALHAGLVRADPVLRTVLDRHAQALLAGLSDDAGTALRVARWLAGNLPRATIAAAAAHVGLSERSLQRRLREEGTGFESVLEELRQQEALRLLGDERLAIAEIAFLLGFSEASAFHRAFKRWTAATPAAFRKGRPG